MPPPCGLNRWHSSKTTKPTGAFKDRFKTFSRNVQYRFDQRCKDEVICFTSNERSRRFAGIGILFRQETTAALQLTDE